MQGRLAVEIMMEGFFYEASFGKNLCLCTRQLSLVVLLFLRGYQGDMWQFEFC